MIDGFWSTEARTNIDVRVLPDGCADVMFDFEKGAAYAIGTMTRPLVLTESVRAFGVRFRPGWGAVLLDEPLAPLTDARAELGTLQTLAARVADAKSDGARIGLLCEWARRQAVRDTPDRRVLAAVDAIVTNGGRASVDEVASIACTTRQHLARLFAHHVGVSPKVFARVVRFRRALQLGKDRPGGWADRASELGYFDQSHLIADFRTFAGDTPVPFFQSAATRRD